eukprot:6368919-Pyramimonas_sp.AAC.1
MECHIGEERRGQLPPEHVLVHLRLPTNRHIWHRGLGVGGRDGLNGGALPDLAGRPSRELGLVGARVLHAWAFGVVMRFSPPCLAMHLVDGVVVPDRPVPAFSPRFRSGSCAQLLLRILQ